MSPSTEILYIVLEYIEVRNTKVKIKLKILFSFFYFIFFFYFCFRQFKILSIMYKIILKVAEAPAFEFEFTEIPPASDFDVLLEFFDSITVTLV